MSVLSAHMNLIVSTLAALYPARVVTRDLKDFAERKKTDLDAGVYTVLSLGESGYANYRGREGMDGTVKILLVGQIRLSENAAPHAVEDAEGAMADEIKGLVRALPPALCSLEMKGFRQSGQVEHPYGWIAVDLEMTE